MTADTPCSSPTCDETAEVDGDILPTACVAHGGPVNGQTITDEQIRQMLDGDQPEEFRRTCLVAIHGPTAADQRDGYSYDLCRARCAAAWNAPPGNEGR